MASVFIKGLEGKMILAELIFADMVDKDLHEVHLEAFLTFESFKSSIDCGNFFLLFICNTS